MNGLSTETRVGMFVLTGLAVLVGFVLVLGDFTLQSSRRVYADFAYVAGLQVGAPVQVSGIHVGTVKNLELLAADASPSPAVSSTGALGTRARPLVRATLAIQSNAEHLLKTDTELAIGTKGVIGEAYVEVVPGSDEAPRLGESGVLRGVDAPKIHVMTHQIAGVLDTLSLLLGAEDGSSLDQVGGALTELLKTFNAVVGGKRNQLSQAIDDLVMAAGDSRAVLAQIRGLMGEGNVVQSILSDSQTSLAMVRQELPVILSLARDSLNTLQSLSARANENLNDKVMKSLMHDVQQSVAGLEKLTRDGQALVTMVRRGEGTVGGVLSDPQIYDDLKEMMRDLKRHPWKLVWRD